MVGGSRVEGEELSVGNRMRDLGLEDRRVLR